MDLVRRSLGGRVPQQPVPQHERADRREQREFSQILSEVEEVAANSDLRGTEILEAIRGKIKELGGYLEQTFVRAVLGSAVLKSFLRVVRGLP